MDSPISAATSTPPTFVRLDTGWTHANARAHSLERSRWGGGWIHKQLVSRAFNLAPPIRPARRSPLRLYPIVILISFRINCRPFWFHPKATFSRYVNRCFRRWMLNARCRWRFWWAINDRISEIFQRLASISLKWESMGELSTRRDGDFVKRAEWILEIFQNKRKLTGNEGGTRCKKRIKIIVNVEEKNCQSSRRWNIAQVRGEFV